MEGLEGLRGVPLCAEPDWDFLLKSKIKIFSFDPFNFGVAIVNYPFFKDFVDKGGVISWGIVPTYTELLEQELIDSLMEWLKTFWEDLSQKGVD